MGRRGGYSKIALITYCSVQVTQPTFMRLHVLQQDFEFAHYHLSSHVEFQNKDSPTSNLSEGDIQKSKRDIEILRY